VIGVRGTLGLGAALALAGLAFEVAALLVPGLALLLLGLVLPAWVRLARIGARVERAEPPSRVVEDETFELAYEVRAGWAPMRATLDDPLLGAPASVIVPVPRRSVMLGASGRIPRRGRHPVPPPSLRISEPLELRRGQAPGTGPEGSILVLPRIEAVEGPDGGPGPSAGALRSGGGDLAAAGLRESPADPEIDGLRPYRAGAPASRIYWPALARGGELLERRIAAGGGSAPLVALDVSGRASEDAVDRAVRAAASLSFHLARAGGVEVLLPGGARRLAVDAGLSAWADVHARFALVTAGDGAPSARELPREAPVFWVSAAGEPARALLAFGYLILAEPLPDRAVAFRIAGCSAHVLGRARTLATTAKAAAR
jgi:uncharacterized protein (DUF58 family)